MNRSCELLIVVGLFCCGCGGDTTTETPVESPDATVETTVRDQSLPPVPPEPAPVVEPMGLVISVDQLQQRLESDAPRIIDVRSVDDYSVAHIPGAVHVDLNDWKRLALSEGGLNDVAGWSQRVGALGITQETDVVVYAESPTDATRIWWTLKYLGVKDVAVLDGGWPAWREAQLLASNSVPEVAAAEFTPEFQIDRLARIEDLIDDPAATSIVDTRSAAEYDGTGGPGEFRGHIPGAVHIEWSEFMTDDGRFRSSDEIQTLLSERGVDTGNPQVVHCQTGGRASVVALALELAGYGPVRNYYCGWSEWSAAEETPVEGVNNAAGP